MKRKPARQSATARHPIKCSRCRSTLLRFDASYLVCVNCDRWGLPSGANRQPNRAA